MSAHTPGPWKMSRESGRDLEPAITAEPSGYMMYVATAHDFGDDGVVANANAHLIAAAPELLATARRWLRIMGDAGADRCGCKPEESYVCCRCEVVGAIAKAEGKS